MYQLLVYPLFGPIWQVILTLLNGSRFDSFTQKDGVQCPPMWNRGIHDNSYVQWMYLWDFPHIGVLRKEQKTCLVNLAHGKDVFAILLILIFYSAVFMFGNTHIIFRKTSWSLQITAKEQSWLSHYTILHSWCNFSLSCNPFFGI